jgi:hypothetical protein
MKNKCESCINGYNGANGNGYQPCGCSKPENKAQPPKKPKFEGCNV